MIPSQHRHRYGNQQLTAVILAAVVLTGISIGARYAEAAPPQAQVPHLVVATKPIEPFIFTTGDEPTEFSIDLWKAIALEAQIDYETVVESLDAVVDGTADAVIAAITITEEREHFLNVSVPYYRSGLGTLTRGTEYSSFFDSARTIITPSSVCSGDHDSYLDNRSSENRFRTGLACIAGQGIILILSGLF